MDSTNPTKKQVSIGVNHLEVIAKMVLTDWEKERIREKKKNVTFAEIMERYISSDPRLYDQKEKRRYIRIGEL